MWKARKNNRLEKSEYDKPVRKYTKKRKAAQLTILCCDDLRYRSAPAAGSYGICHAAKRHGVCVTMLAPGATAPDISGTNINPKAPDITCSLAALSGKAVVVIFFAWWCPHCGNELGFLQNLWKKYQGHEVGFVAVHTETDDAHARQYGYPNALSAATSKLTALGIQFPAVQDDTQNTIFNHYDGPGYGFPQLYILDKDHIIHSVVDGEEPESATDNRILDAHSSRNPVDIEIVMDVSDSMNSPASAGVSKLAVMKQAAKMVVDFSHSHGMTSDRMGLVWFTDDVTRYPTGNILLPVMANMNALKNRIDAKHTRTCTAMGAGLQTAFDLLASSTQKRFAIMLTDGMQDVDPMVCLVGDHFEIIDAPVEYHCSKTHSGVKPRPGVNITSHHTRVHTIGVGITAAYSSLLSDISAATGGTYLVTMDTVNDLALLCFVDLCTCHAGGSPAIVYHNTGTFRSGQCQSTHRFFLNRTIRKFTAILSWQKLCAGNLTFWLRAPDGTIVGLHKRIKFFDTYVMATVPLPVEQDGRELSHSGEWQMIVRGEIESTVPYQVGVVCEDNGTHFEVVHPPKVYEVGDVLSLQVGLKEGRKYLADPAEIVLQEKRLHVPLTELLARYPFQPEMVKTKTGKVAKISTVHPESRLKALAADPRYEKQLKPNVITRSLRKGTLECAITQKEITVPVTLTEPGAHTYRVEVRFDSEKNGPISRITVLSVYVGVGTPDQKQSVVTMVPVESGKTKGMMMLVTPKNSAGHIIGPGRKAGIRLLIGNEEPKYSIEDLLDGTYRITIKPGKTGFKKIRKMTLLLMDKIFWKGKMPTVS